MGLFDWLKPKPAVTVTCSQCSRPLKYAGSKWLGRLRAMAGDGVQKMPTGIVR